GPGDREEHRPRDAEQRKQPDLIERVRRRVQDDGVGVRHDWISYRVRSKATAEFAEVAKRLLQGPRVTCARSSARSAACATWLGCSEVRHRKSPGTQTR